MENISDIKDCCGCGVCAVICPQQVISIELDKNGFYQPKIVNNNKCTHCGLCFSVCAYSHNDLSLDKPDKIDGYAAWSNDDAIRYKCSSGGIGFELGKHLLKQGYKTCGVKYNVEQCRAEHFIADNEIDYQDSIGSKYIQSYTLNAFTTFKKEEKYFVTGTPCQIDSLRRYIRIKKSEDNFVLMDFFCHGVPSMLMWNKYIKSIENKNGKLSQISWRNKKTGWHDSWIMSSDVEKYFSPLSKGDLFYRMFLKNICLGKACYDNCKYKALSSSADIRIGDLWGKSYNHEDKGVSGVLVLTEKGRQIFESLKKKVTFNPEDVSVVMEGQMKTFSKKPKSYYVVMFLLKTRLPLDIIYTIAHLVEKSLDLNKIIMRKVKRYLSI